jgi:hypothetical protein
MSKEIANSRRPNPTLSAILSAYSAEFLRIPSVLTAEKMAEKTRETSLGDIGCRSIGLFANVLEDDATPRARDL